MRNEVDDRLKTLMAEYTAEQTSDAGDPDGYIDRMWTLLENMRESPEQNDVAIEAVTTFLDRVERTNERPT